MSDRDAGPTATPVGPASVPVTGCLVNAYVLSYTLRGQTDTVKRAVLALVTGMHPVIRNYAVAQEATDKSSVIARSETTKQSALAVWEIATGLRPRNDSRILYQVNNSAVIVGQAIPGGTRAPPRLCSYMLPP